MGNKVVISPCGPFKPHSIACVLFRGVNLVSQERVGQRCENRADDTPRWELLADRPSGES